MPSSSRNKPDVVFLHAPSVYDFRKRSIVYGPVSDLVPSTPIFEMYPIGFSSLAAYLRNRGIDVRIINLAVRMLLDPAYDVEDQIKQVDPELFGIDLHWMPHCHGAVEIARLVKKHHPDTPIVFGGFSSSYWHKDLMKYPEIDFVIRGDSTEEPMTRLVNEVMNGRRFESVPNLTWRLNGATVVNDLSHVPTDIDGCTLGYQSMVKSVFHFRDFTGILPFRDWYRYPIMATFAGRGCRCNCVFCGGSYYTFKNTMNREGIAYRSPEALVAETKRIARLSRGPIFMLGDIRMAGHEYAEKVLKGIVDAKIKNKIILEFYALPPLDFLDTVDAYLKDYSYEMSIESHDEKVRRAIGKGYSNAELEALIVKALSFEKCERFDLYFMVGLPEQTYSSAVGTVDYCRDLYALVGNDKRLLVFTSPLAPFLDPGSQAFVEPEKHGYRLLLNTLEEHRQALLNPSWKYILNYETVWMDRDEIVRATYDAARGLNRLKQEVGAIDDVTAQDTEERIALALEIMGRVDEIMAIEDTEERERRLAAFKDEVEKSSIATVADKGELEWSARANLANWKLLEVARIAFSRNPE